MSINCNKRRHSASVLQSFAFLNGPFVNEQADKMAALIGATKGDKIGLAFRRALSRDPSKAEAAECAEFLEEQAAIYVKEKLDNPKAAKRALRDLCHLLLTTNEFLYVD